MVFPHLLTCIPSAEAVTLSNSWGSQRIRSSGQVHTLLLNIDLSYNSLLLLNIHIWRAVDLSGSYGTYSSTYIGRPWCSSEPKPASREQCRLAGRFFFHEKNPRTSQQGFRFETANEPILISISATDADRRRVRFSAMHNSAETNFINWGKDISKGSGLRQSRSPT